VTLAPRVFCGALSFLVPLAVIASAVTGGKDAVEHGAKTSHSVIFPACMLSLAKVPPDGRYQFHALFPDWNEPVGNLGPAVYQRGLSFGTLYCESAKRASAQ
jgi:hypothetical protein